MFRNQLIHSLVLWVLAAFVPSLGSAAPSELADVARTVRESCQGRPCQGAWGIETVASPPATVWRIADDLTQTWGDTILEGDITSDGHTQLDGVEIIRWNGNLIAYRVVYSQGAESPWGPGRITETAWIGADLRESLVDELFPAAFRRRSF